MEEEEEGRKKYHGRRRREEEVPWTKEEGRESTVGEQSKC